MRSARLCLVIWACCILCCCIICCAAKRGGSRKTKLVPRVLYLDRCEDKLHYVYPFNYSAILDNKGILLINLGFDIRKEIKKSLSLMRITLHRCREAVTSNTCEYFATWPFTGNICNLITAKGMMWSSFFRSFHPKFVCPFKAGIYRLDNATVDVDFGETMAHINIADNVWNVMIELVDQDNELWSCLKTAVQISRVNVKT